MKIKAFQDDKEMQNFIIKEQFYFIKYNPKIGSRLYMLEIMLDIKRDGLKDTDNIKRRIKQEKEQESYWTFIFGLLSFAIIVIICFLSHFLETKKKQNY